MTAHRNNGNSYSNNNSNYNSNNNSNNNNVSNKLLKTQMTVGAKFSCVIRVGIGAIDEKLPVGFAHFNQVC